MNQHIAQFYKFELLFGEKYPASGTKWSERATWSKTVRPTKQHNYAILCGEANNITVVDLDTHKWKADHPFFAKFGRDVRAFGTLTQKTPSGGYHLIFEHDVEIAQTQNKKYEVDIRNDGGYIVGQGSQVGGNKYTIWNDAPVQTMSQPLKAWLLEHLWSKDEVVAMGKRRQTKGVLQDHEDMSRYGYVIDIDTLHNMFKRIPVALLDLSRGQDWRLFTSAMKQIVSNYPHTSAERKLVMKFWDTHSRKFEGYDRQENVKFWDALKITVSSNWLEAICNKSWKEGKKTINSKEFLGFMKYKPVPRDVKTVDLVLNRRHLGDVFAPNKNYVVRSDTGTGKTTSFKNYVEGPFISIVSRVSLGRE